MNRRGESLLQAIEGTLRRSWLASLLPYLRERFPQLHRLLLHGRDLLVPYHSAAGVTRYQHRALRRFHATRTDLGLSGTILELGSDESTAVLTELAAMTASAVIGVNPAVNRTAATLRIGAANKAALVQADARHLPFGSACMSSVFSVATLEHIFDLEVALAESYRVLAPGGLFYADFGPIWSCSVGHHVYARVGDEEARHWKPGKNPVPNYAHLLLSREAMGTRLSGKVSSALLEAILEWIFDGDGVNRLFFEDYLRVFRASSFELVALTPVLEHVDRHRLEALRSRYPTHDEFRCRMIEVILRKLG
jgi:SAM-dependent methyltransferase